MDLSPKRILKILKENGWELDRIKGSHHIFVKENESVPIPIHGNHDLKKGTFFAILKKIGVDKNEID
jgi:predicted RNA binding protein YcfA (HicA-like mRNA interferase family)